LFEPRARLAVELPVPDEVVLVPEEPEEPEEPPLHVPVPVPVLLDPVLVELVPVVPVPAVVIVVGVTEPVVVVAVWAMSCESRF
jgi:hypothetical protein